MAIRLAESRKARDPTISGYIARFGKMGKLRRKIFTLKIVNIKEASNHYTDKEGIMSCILI